MKDAGYYADRLRESRDEALAARGVDTSVMTNGGVSQMAPSSWDSTLAKVQSRYEHAQEALDGYLAKHPEVAGSAR